MLDHVCRALCVCTCMCARASVCVCVSLHICLPGLVHICVLMCLHARDSRVLRVFCCCLYAGVVACLRFCLPAYSPVLCCCPFVCVCNYYSFALFCIALHFFALLCIALLACLLACLLSFLRVRRVLEAFVFVGPVFPKKLLVLPTANRGLAVWDIECGAKWLWIKTNGTILG